MSSLRIRASWLVLLAGLLGAGCKDPYRVGEKVLVEWVEDQEYPAYITEQVSDTRYRVHFEGYEERWDREVSVDKIKGRVEEPVTPPPPPDFVQRASGVPPPSASASASPVAPFKVGDRVRVQWRGSQYKATVVGVVARDKFLVHYDGYEDAWNEVVEIDRIQAR